VINSSNHIPIDFNSGNVSTSGACSDSGESMSGNRSESNATPPMHFLTPHVEISMTEPTGTECSSFSSQVIIIFKCLIMSQIIFKFYKGIQLCNLNNITVIN